jgi:hypothetical protein
MQAPNIPSTVWLNMNVKYTCSHYMEYAVNKNMTVETTVFAIMHCPLSYCTEITWLWDIRRGQSIWHPNWLERANQLQQILIYSWWTWQSTLNLPTKIDYLVPSPQKLITSNLNRDGFGGLVVSMLASGSRVCRFDPDRSRWIFSDVKKSSACLPSEGK